MDVGDLVTRPEMIRTGQETAEPGSTDRRRPGRAEQAHPALIPLLCQPTGDTMVATTDTEAGADDGSPSLASSRDDLGLARGIAVALLLMLPFWCAVLLAI